MELIDILQKRIDKAYVLTKFILRNTNDEDAKVELHNILDYLSGRMDHILD